MKRHSEEEASHLRLWELKNVITVVHSTERFIHSAVFVDDTVCLWETVVRGASRVSVDSVVRLTQRGVVTLQTLAYSMIRCWRPVLTPTTLCHVDYCTLHARSSMATHFRRSKQLMFVKTRSKVNDAHPWLIQNHCVVFLSNYIFWESELWFNKRWLGNNLYLLLWELNVNSYSQPIQNYRTLLAT